MKKALIVGLNNYPNNELYGCINDANILKKTLESNENGSKNFDVRLITDASSCVTKAHLKQSIEQLFHGDADIALFYFSGHGYVDTTGGVIVTSDFKAYDEGIPMDYILKHANNSNARDKIIILDCCHSGAFGSESVDDCSAHLSEGLTVLSASKSDESAVEINGSGIFTSLLVDGLNGGAADLGGNITPGSLYAYVDQALGPWDQRPIFKTNVSKFTSIRNINPPVPIKKLRKLSEYFKTSEEEYPLDPTYEFTEHNAIESHVEIFKDLQKFASVGLVIPVGAEYMYFAAINSKSCKLTTLGHRYWKLIKEKRL